VTNLVQPPYIFLSLACSVPRIILRACGRRRRHRTEKYFFLFCTLESCSCAGVHQAEERERALAEEVCRRGIAIFMIIVRVRTGCGGGKQRCNKVHIVAAAIKRRRSLAALLLKLLLDRLQGCSSTSYKTS
jgi:hypothetical protein